MVSQHTLGRGEKTKLTKLNTPPPPSSLYFLTQSPTSVYVPVLHAGELGGGLLEVVVVAVGEGAQAASYQGHSAEASAGLAGCVGAGGVLLAVLTVTRGLQPVVRTCKRHLHGCWGKGPLELLQDKQVCL